MSFCRLFLIETSIERISFRLRREFFDQLLQQEIAFFDKRTTGELVNRISNDVTVTSRVLIDASMGMRSTISAVVGAGMVFTLAPQQMMATLLVPAIGIFGVGLTYGYFVRKIAKTKQERLADAVQHASERVSGIRTVRTFNAEGRESRTFLQNLDSVYEAGWQNAMAQGGMSAVFVTGGGLFLLHLFFNCGMMVSSGLVSLGTTMSLAMYCFMTGSGFAGVVSAYGDIQKALGASERVMEVLRANTSQSEAEVAAVLTGLKPRDTKPLAVRFEDVKFAYPSRPDIPVLNGFSIDIPCGARVALLGRSGSGKSTVAFLLTRLYEPEEGRIFFDDQDITTESSAWARDQIAFVSQEPTLFGGSVRDNIAYGLHDDVHKNSDRVDESVRRASASASVDEFTQRLPDGLETPVGERGQSLSGGQRQRVAIARALARQPRLLLLDEATSALDQQSEALVHAALKEAVLGTGGALPWTSLVITHRLSALTFVDHVAVIHEGRLAQYGPKDDVLANPSAELKAILSQDNVG